VGGRWNRPGTAVVYTSESLALAALELLVHVALDTAPADLVSLAAEIPDGIAVERLTIEDLPRNWRSHPAPPGLADLGAQWVERDRTAFMAVPSAVIPGETNYLLNPRHRDFARIRVGRPARFDFDPRLVARPRRRAR
jgi:RES domain-containing protein